MKNNSNLFWEACDEALFSQKPIADVLQLSEATLERNRWIGAGIPFLKIGKSVRYRKKDVLAWLQKHAPTVSSTSQYKQEVGNE